MITPPEGEVTFLFTDIEGSTILAQREPHRLSELISVHDKIIKSSVDLHSGYVVKNAGDSFTAAFGDPSNAVLAVYEIQKKLFNEFGKNKELLVRAGIHCGYVEWKCPEYSGYLTLSRAQRIMSTAAGGQTLVSSDVMERLGDFRSSDFSFRDLGEHRLKDLIKPVRLYQLSGIGLPDDFPPLRTLNCRPNNLPLLLNNLIGRVDLIDKIKSLLSESRLITLTGPGGVGKTKLSLHASADMIEDFRNGVWLIQLANLNSKELMLHEIASVLKISEEGESDLQDAITASLKDKELLLIFDNCEHLAAECAVISEEILTSTSSVRIIASSRETLKVAGERNLKVPSLQLPSPGKKLQDTDVNEIESVRLFTERARAIQEDFVVSDENAEHIAELCIRLDGIPLAIELAAARVNVLPVNKIVEKLSDRFRLLTGGKRTALPRQQTLKALIDWSYDLLTESERKLFRRLSIFESGWTLDASEFVCSFDGIEEYEVLDLLSELIDKSLVSIIDEEMEVRYGMLESLREYAIGKVDMVESEILNERHFRFYFNMGKQLFSDEKVDPKLEILKNFLKEKGNVRKSIVWAIKNDIESLMKIITELEWFWDNLGSHNEAYNLLCECISKYEGDSMDLLGKAKSSAGYFANNLCKYEESESLFKEALEIHTNLGNKKGIAECHVLLGILFVNLNKLDKANLSLAESYSLSLEVCDQDIEADSLANLSVIDLKSGNLDMAYERGLKAQAIYKRLGKFKALGKTLNNLGAVEFYRGNFDQARRFYQESLGLLELSEDRYTLCVNLMNIGNIYLNQNNLTEASSYYERGMNLIRENDFVELSGFMLIKMADLALAKGDLETAERFYEEALDLQWVHNDTRKIATIFRGFGNISYSKKEYEDSLFYLTFSQKQFEISGFMLPNDKTSEYNSKLENLRLLIKEQDFTRIVEKISGISIEEAIERRRKS